MMLIAVLLPAMGTAMDGVPPTFRFAGEGLAGDGSYIFSMEPEFGCPQGFVGGNARRSLQMDRYVLVPLVLRYGFLPDWEVYSVLPYYWGSSPQEFTNYATIGDPVTIRQTLKGQDFGDIDTLIKWRVWESDEKDSAFLVHMGGSFPTGTDPWENVMYNYVTGPDTPRISFGDGAFELMGAAQWSYEGGSAALDALAGASWRMPLEATAMEPYGSKINVEPSSLLVGRVRGTWRGGESSWWLAGILEGYWSTAGRVTATGYLAKEPGSLSRVIDSYANLVKASAGLWGGVGAGWQFSQAVSLGAEVKAPLVVGDSYRYWRSGLIFSYGAKVL